jgi:elongation factor P hydroxylase
MLSKAAGYKFHISIDNLNGQKSDTFVFKNAVYAQVVDYCIRGLPERAQTFRHALCAFYEQPTRLRISDFSLEEL